MSNVKFVLNRSGVRDLLKSDGIYQVCAQHAEMTRASAGPGYEVGQRNYPERTGAAVYPATADAYYDNLRHNTLLKALK